MKFEGKSRRARERLKLQLPVRVQGREAGAHDAWVELTRLLDVTPFGAAFKLARVSEPGRLLHLTMPLPRQLRCFDHVEDQYRVWALVRSVRQASPAGASSSHQQHQAVGFHGGSARYDIGVAFIGKHAPSSYARDPATRYEVVSDAREGALWEVREMPQQSAGTEGAGAAAPRTAETRIQMPVDVVVETIDGSGSATAREETVTENISRRGASVWTTLPVVRGQFVRLTSLRPPLTVTAVVRARRKGADGIERLHLEFIDKQWPLEGLNESQDSK